MTGPTDAPASVYTAGDVLAQWREAERRLSTLPPDSPEIDVVQADINLYRTRYQELFRRNA